MEFICVFVVFVIAYVTISSSKITFFVGRSRFTLDAQVSCIDDIHDAWLFKP